MKRPTYEPTSYLKRVYAERDRLVSEIDAYNAERDAGIPRARHPDALLDPVLDVLANEYRAGRQSDRMFLSYERDLRLLRFYRENYGLPLSTTREDIAEHKRVHVEPREKRASDLSSEAYGLEQCRKNAIIREYEQQLSVHECLERRNFDAGRSEESPPFHFRYSPALEKYLAYNAARQEANERQRQQLYSEWQEFMARGRAESERQRKAEPDAGAARDNASARVAGGKPLTPEA